MKPLRKYGNQYAIDPYIATYNGTDLEPQFRQLALREIFNSIAEDIQTDKIYAFHLAEHKDMTFSGLVINKLVVTLFEEGN